MTAFVYNNNEYLNSDRTFNELFENYIINFANEFINRLIKEKHFLLLKEQNDCEITESTCENYEKKIAKRQELNYNVHHRAIIFNEKNKVFL